MPSAVVTLCLAAVLAAVAVALGRLARQRESRAEAALAQAATLRDRVRAVHRDLAVLALSSSLDAAEEPLALPDRPEAPDRHEALDRPEARRPEARRRPHGPRPPRPAPDPLPPARP